MSLPEAMLSLADDLEEVLSGLADTYSKLDGDEYNQRIGVVKSFVKQIRRAVKAAEGSQQTMVSHAVQTPYMDATTQNRIMIDQAREEFRNAKRMSNIEEELGTKTVELVGAQWTGEIPTHIEAPNNIKVGDKTVVDGVVFVYKADGKAHASVIETEKAKKEQFPKILLGNEHE